MNKVLLIGGGGHARSLIEAVGSDIFEGYVANEPSQLPIPYLGNDATAAEAYNPNSHSIHLAVGINNGCSLTLRRKILELFSQFGGKTIIAPSAIVTPSSTLGQGCCIMHRAVINRSSLGEHCVVNTGAIIEHDCTIGNNVFIAPGAILCGEVSVGNDVFIGAGAVVRNCASIASSVSIAMGAVVTSSISEPGIYAGNPAKLMKRK